MPTKILLALCAALALAGCNTMEGFGRDVSATGDALEGTAEDTQRSM